MACLGVVALAAGAWGMQGSRDQTVEQAATRAADESLTQAERELGLIRIRAVLLTSASMLREVADGSNPQLATMAQQTIDDLRSALSD